MRSVPEWIGKTLDAPIPPRVRLRLFEQAQGRCTSCKRKLHPGDRWEIDHVKALCCGGKHQESNLAVVCAWCHCGKTSIDVAIKSGIYKRRSKHVGIKKPRSIRTWKKFDGTPVFAPKER